MDQLVAYSAQLNNYGIQQLNKEDYIDAVDSFTSSLRIVKDLMTALSRRGTTEDTNSTLPCSQQYATPISNEQFLSHQEARPCNRAAYQDNEVCGAETHPDERITASPYSPQHKNMHHRLSKGNSQQDAYIYETPLQICASDLLCREVNHDLLVEISAAVMFNLALCHHLRALHVVFSVLHDHNRHDENAIMKILGQAVSLYELAYALQLREDIELSVECTMAVVNNLGHIHRYLGNEEKSSMCFSHLLSTLLFLQSSSNDEHDQPASATATEGFVQSISHLILTKQVAPAA